jgi:hypothetical protein
MPKLFNVFFKVTTYFMSIISVLAFIALAIFLLCTEKSRNLQKPNMCLYHTMYSVPKTDFLECGGENPLERKFFPITRK